MNYATLYEVKRYLKLTSTDDDDILKDTLNKSSKIVEWWKGRRFDVRKATFKFDTPSQSNLSIGDFYQSEFNVIERLFSKDIYLDTSRIDLLEVITLLNGDGSAILSTDYFTEPYDLPFINRIKLKKSSGLSWLPSGDGDYEQAISLTGFCGYHENYLECFIGTGETLTGQLTANATSFTVTDANGSAEDLISPRIQEGQMLRLESVNGIEFMLVLNISIGVDPAPDTVTVKRGYNGTTAVIHPLGTAIEVFRVDGTVSQAVLRLAQWRYRQKDTDTFDKVYDLGMNTITVPSALPADVKVILGARRMYL